MRDAASSRRPGHRQRTSEHPPGHRQRTSEHPPGHRQRTSEHPPGNGHREVRDAHKTHQMVLPDIVILRQAQEAGNNSAPGSRSSSFRSPKRPDNLAVKYDNSLRRKSMGDSMDSSDPEVNKCTDSTDGHPLQRVRSFKMGSKGRVINRGDSFRRQSTESIDSNGSRKDSLGTVHVPSKTSVGSRQTTKPEGHHRSRGEGHQRTSEHPHKTLTHAEAQKKLEEQARALLQATEVPSEVFQVSIIGTVGTGKTSLKHQFMASDYSGDVEGKYIPTQKINCWFIVDSTQ